MEKTAELKGHPMVQIMTDWGTMESTELHALRQQKLEKMQGFQKDVHKLKKKFKSGQYDRQVICEHILSYHRQIDGLIAELRGIDRILEGEPPSTQS